MKGKLYGKIIISKRILGFFKGEKTVLVDPDRRSFGLVKSFGCFNTKFRGSTVCVHTFLVSPFDSVPGSPTKAFGDDTIVIPAKAGI